MRIAVSLCLPAFNEEANIEKAIDDAKPILDIISDNWEIVVVDDGSSDSTAEIVERLITADKRIRLIQHGYNIGYGQALITAFYSAEKEWVWLSAADNQFSPQEIFKLLPFTSGYDAIVGYRYHRADPSYRRLYAKMYNSLIQVVLGIKIKDLNCGFKLVRKRVFSEINLISAGALIDAEFFVKLKKNGILLKEVAIEHIPRLFGRQTGGNFSVILRMFIELLELKIRLRV